MTVNNDLSLRPPAQNAVEISQLDIYALGYAVDSSAILACSHHYLNFTKSNKLVYELYQILRNIIIE
ncbi:MAG: hypothetical protein AMJ53_06570 [Gammaproteobacteria bacterium SG8_11]|nr:MAG: hypothetical protein AMJ53_06570 [Gammaproteobacteria bacterium SG8_11]